MTRTRFVAAAAVTTALVATPVAGQAAPEYTPSASWKTIAQYCSPTGDLCYGIRAKGHKIQFRMDSFVDFGTVDFCVRKRKQKRWVCHEVDLKAGAHELYSARIRWQGNYPTKGKAKRIVRFVKGSPKLSFKP